MLINPPKDNMFSFYYLLKDLYHWCFKKTSHKFCRIQISLEGIYIEPWDDPDQAVYDQVYLDCGALKVLMSPFSNGINFAAPVMHHHTSDLDHKSWYRSLQGWYAPHDLAFPFHRLNFYCKIQNTFSLLF